MKRLPPWSTCCDVCFHPDEHVVRLDFETFGRQLDICAACLTRLLEVANGSRD